MYAAEVYGGSFWWLCPVLMVVFCFFMAKGRKGRKMCGFFDSHKDIHPNIHSDSPIEILDKRFALGKIDEIEYEKKKRTLS